VDPGLQRKRFALPSTHARIAHTALSFLEIEPSICRPEMDILRGARH
jgi:hypothetical protein